MCYVHATTEKCISMRCHLRTPTIIIEQMPPRTRQASAKAKKITFTDDGELPEGASPVMVDDKSSDDAEQLKEQSESESDSDSDDAPEEESISASKAKSIKQQKEQEKREQELRKQEKQKRKEQDVIYQQQQQEKKKRLEEIMASSELPDLLPEELLEEYSQPTEDLPKGKHMRSEDLENEYAEMRKKAKLEKLKQLKQLRTLAIKKGPVHVQVQTFGEKKKSVPRADPKVVESKSSWLNRDSLRRK